MAIHCGKCGHGPINFDSISNHDEPECPKCGADILTDGITDAQVKADREALDKALADLCSTDTPIGAGRTK